MTGCRVLVRSLTLGRFPAGTVTTVDLFKFAGVLSFLVDHYGLFFDPEDNWWRLVGRIAAPIFFFLVGFARNRTVPLSWVLLGLALTAADYLTSDGLGDT